MPRACLLYTPENSGKIGPSVTVVATFFHVMYLSDCIVLYTEVDQHTLFVSRYFKLIIDWYI
jgi:hypothetical protein